MTTNKKSAANSSLSSSLRADAEAKVASVSPAESSERPQSELVHELHVHQIELEMQNEELRRAHHDLEESRDGFFDLYEFAPVGYLTVSHEGLISKANLTVTGMLGFDRKKLIRRRFAFLVAASDRDRWDQFFIHAKRHGGSQTCELEIQRADGTALPVAVSCVSKDGDVRLTLTDISERKNAETELRMSEVRFRLALSESPIVVFEQDLDLRYTWIYNPKLGYAAEEVIGKTDAEVMEAEAADVIAALKLSVIRTGRPIRREVATSAPGGVVTHYDLTIEPRRDETERVVGVICAATDISERRLAEQALQQSGTLYRRMLDAVPSSIAVLDRSGVIAWTNEQWRRFGAGNGVTFAEHAKGTHVGENYLDICRAASGDGSEGAKEAHDGILGVLEFQEEKFALEYSCNLPDQECWFEMIAVPLWGDDQSALVIHTDITARKAVEENTRQSRDQLKSFILHAPIGIAMFDKNMNYLATSERWKVHYGRGCDDLVGCNHYKVHPDLPARWMEVHQHCLAGATLENDEDLWIQADGSKHWLRWAVRPWKDANGEIGGIIIAGEDITDQKNAEDALKAVLDWNIVRQKVAAMAHEINQPLGSMSALCEALIRLTAKKGEAGFDVAEAIEPVVRQMKSECLRAGDVVRNLLGSLQKPDIAPEPIDLSVLLREAALNATKVRYFGCKVVVTCENNLQPVRANRQQMEHALMNLIGNSADAMVGANTLGGRIWVNAALQPDRSSACIAVRDEGPGISEEMASQMFYPFVTSKIGGTGMGLAISRSLIEANGGRLWHEPHDGPGATFCFTLPLVD